MELLGTRAGRFRSLDLGPRLQGRQSLSHFREIADDLKHIRQPGHAGGIAQSSPLGITHFAALHGDLAGEDTRESGEKTGADLRQQGRDGGGGIVGPDNERLVESGIADLNVLQAQAVAMRMRKFCGASSNVKAPAPGAAADTALQVWRLLPEPVV